MQCVFVSAELEQGLMAQLKSVISRGGGLYCLELLEAERSFGSLNSERPNLLISAPSVRPPLASKTNTSFQTGFP